MSISTRYLYTLANSGFAFMSASLAPTFEKIQQKKETYTAARELSGAWEVEHSLVSLLHATYDEEIEL